ncbi:beta-ketoacyl synthase N-terminal-like domain-containing protein [Burkholderia gladioli]|uniref:beta-ketoacyl synthase N-terminal-like domain-containing protein n=1 Tax=Burkholderia gladioli TaxID=28095 RepID=UPI003F7A0108
MNTLLSVGTSVLLYKGATLAPDDRCKTFEAAADGYVLSKGLLDGVAQAPGRGSRLRCGVR